MMTLEEIVDRNWTHIALTRMYTYILGYTSEKSAIKTITETVIFIDRVEKDIAKIAEIKAYKAAREAGL